MAHDRFFGFFYGMLAWSCITRVVNGDPFYLIPLALAILAVIFVPRIANAIYIHNRGE